MSDEASGRWNPSDVAQYIAAAFTKLSHEGHWPDNVDGNAARLLIQDLGEFAEVMVAAGRAHYWSPANALGRLFIERVEVLMGACVDNAVSKRYLDSVVAEPTAERPNRPAKRVRPEDAVGRFLSRSGLGAEDQASFRAALVDVKNLYSEWFVHPRVMAPLLSRAAGESENGVEEYWSHMIQLLAFGCSVSLLAANRLQVTIPVECVRALYAAGKCLEQLGNVYSEGVLDLHATIAERAVPEQAERIAGS
ncbi:MAG TPA: hypothetical protein VNL92_07105 [Dehalococcoidia bacterium]|nr:hypothetical protein [Dehalococcoidia bacterium]